MKLPCIFLCRRKLADINKGLKQTNDNFHLPRTFRTQNKQIKTRMTNSWKISFSIFNLSCSKTILIRWQCIQRCLKDKNHQIISCIKIDKEFHWIYQLLTSRVKIALQNAANCASCDFEDFLEQKILKLRV